MQHHDLDVLAIEVVETTKAEIIESRINNLANTVGKPLQIISDHGSDIKKADARGGELQKQTNQVQAQTEKLVKAPLPPPRRTGRSSSGNKFQSQPLRKTQGKRTKQELNCIFLKILE